MKILFYIIAAFWVVTLVGWVISFTKKAWRANFYYLYWALGMCVLALCLNIITAII